MKRSRGLRERGTIDPGRLGFRFESSGRVGKRTASIATALVAFLLLVAPALRAHNIFSSWTDAVVRTDRIELDLTLSRTSALRLIVDGDKLPPITPENFGDYEAKLKASALELFVLSAADQALPLTASSVKISGEDDVAFTLIFPRPAGGTLRFLGNYVQFLIDGHVGTLVIKNSDDSTIAWGPVSIDQPVVDINLPAIDAPAPADPPKVISPSFTTFLKLGLHHILIGYDHLLFLFGLIIACRRFATMAVIITCFTLAHSITLALAAFDVVTLSPRVVEPFIAASIVFVGVENLIFRGREPKRRWLVTFAFGLVHGFGFAGALKEVGHGLTGTALALPLFSFNLGVELGQIAVAALCLPVLFLLRRYAAFERYGPPVVSAVVALAGGYWLLQRTVLS
ncbi:MAG: HupE/UreJ family protein [Opitutaceae bacterium]